MRLGPWMISVLLIPRNKDGLHRRCERSHKKVRAGNDGFRRCARDLPAFLRNTIETSRRCRFSIGGQNTSVGIHPDHHKRATDQQWLTSSPSIDPDQCRHSHENIDDILNRGGVQADVPRQTCHGEHVYGMCQWCKQRVSVSRLT